MSHTRAQHENDPHHDSDPVQSRPEPPDAAGRKRSHVEPSGAEQAVANEEAALETGEENTA
jgi:hypothetical protein